MRVVGPFHYVPACSAPDCNVPAVFKIGAIWSDRTSRELKNYGLACTAHRDQQLALARRRRGGLKLSDGETLGPVTLYTLKAGARDRDLVPVLETSAEWPIQE